MSSAISEQSPRQELQARVERMPSREIFETTVREMWRDNALGTSAEIAFFYSFAIPPLLIFLVMLAAILNQQTDIAIVDGLRNLIEVHAPTDTQPVFNSLVDRAIEKVNSGIASVGVLVAALLSIWSISNAISALIRVSNRAYNVKDDRSFLERRLLSLGLALVVIFTVNPAIILFFFGDYLGRFIADRVGLGSAFEFMWEIGRWPLAIAFIVVQLAVLYHFLPNVEQSFRWATVGSLIAALVWMMGAASLLIYLQFTDPASVYGAFGSLLLLLAFLYITGFSFLLGAEINAILARNFDSDVTADLRQNPEKSTGRKEISRGVEPA